MPSPCRCTSCAERGKLGLPPIAAHRFRSKVAAADRADQRQASIFGQEHTAELRQYHRRSLPPAANLNLFPENQQ